MITALSVAAGGALGAMARYGVNVATTKLYGPAFPYGTLAVNILGCFIMGLLIGLFMMKDPINPTFKLFLTTGVLGGFTTFSAFSYEAIMLYERKPIIGFVYVLTSVIVSIIACWIGLRLMRGMNA